MKLANIKLAMKELFHRHHLAIPKKHVLSSERSAFHLTERKLSEDQFLRETADGRVRLSPTVADTAELRWWLLGFGEGVEVIGPKALRAEFKETAENMARAYS